MTRLTRNSLTFFLVWPVVFVLFLFLLPVPKESPTAQAKPLRKPAGVCGSSLRRELLHTSSPSSGVVWAGDIRTGFISIKSTL